MFLKISNHPMWWLSGYDVTRLNTRVQVRIPTTGAAFQWGLKVNVLVSVNCVLVPPVVAEVSCLCSPHFSTAASHVASLVLKH